MSQNYYVVNTGRGRGTHIMLSNSPRMQGLISLAWSGAYKVTLCGLPATRYVNVFTPAEASCRECRKRWQLALDPPATATQKPLTASRWQEPRTSSSASGSRRTCLMSG